MTSAELLELFNDLASRPATDAISNTKKYTWLARAEREVISELASIRPQILYPKVGTANMPQLSTTDNNVWTFGTDGDGALIVPFGKCEIFRKLTDIPDRPLVPGYDYLDEGNQIRMPRNRTLTAPLYYRGIVMPAKITAAEPPHLIPSDANELTAIRAVKNFAATRNPALSAAMTIRWKERFPYWCLLLKQQFSRGGALVTWSLKDVVTPLL